MRVGERQCLGALTFLIASVIVYGAALLYRHVSLSHVFLPWGNLMAGVIAVEVQGAGVLTASISCRRVCLWV